MVGKDIAPRRSGLQLVIMRQCTRVLVYSEGIHKALRTMGTSASSGVVLQKLDFQVKARVTFSVSFAGHCNPRCLCAATDQTSPTNTLKRYKILCLDAWTRRRCLLLARSTLSSFMGKVQDRGYFEQELVVGTLPGGSRRAVTMDTGGWP